MAFVSNYSLNQRTRGGLVLAKYMVRSEAGHEGLLYSEREITSRRDFDRVMQAGERRAIQEILADEMNRSQWITMIENTPGGRFEYFGQPQLNQAGTWMSAWDAEARALPKGVALRFGRAQSQTGSQQGDVEDVIAAAVSTVEGRERRLPNFF